MKSWLSKYRRRLLLALPFVIIALILLIMPFNSRWLGIYIYKYDATGQIIGIEGVRSLWDLLDLLIVPIALSLMAYWLDSQARKRENQIEQHEADQYKKRLIIQMGSPNGRFALEALRQLSALTSLKDGILQEVDLSEANLASSDFRNANLRGASLRKTILERADLSNSDLTIADLTAAMLTGANLSAANLSQANFSQAYLHGANLNQANLSGANLSRAIVSGANLDAVNLWEANLCETNLSKASLTKANLKGADLSGADLSQANLQNSQVTRRQLEGTAKLADAIMPDGRKYEDWVAAGDIAGRLDHASASDDTDTPAAASDEAAAVNRQK